MNLINRATLIEHEKMITDSALHYANTGSCMDPEPFLGTVDSMRQRNIAQWPMELVRHATYVQARHHGFVIPTIINIRCAYDGIAKSLDEKGIPAPLEGNILTLLTHTSCRIGNVDVEYNLCNDMLYATRYRVALDGNVVATGNVCKEFGELAFEDFDPDCPEDETCRTRSDFEVCTLFRMATCLLALRAQGLAPTPAPTEA